MTTDNVKASPTVRVAHGRVRGRRDGDVSVFLGIPYAAPPFGDRRLCPPMPPHPWDGIREATRYGATATRADYYGPYQGLYPEPIIPGDDCLNLNVWTPDPGGRGLPVLVWIHGGAFTNGSNAVDPYDGSSFARDGVVCVGINYRLGAEGFAHADEATNLGLLDQLAALQWVQENIAAFGGDPSKVAVAGESAGAMSIMTLLSIPRAKGLFRRAVAQSGAAAHTLSRDTARMVVRDLAERLGVAPTRKALAGVDPDRVVVASRALLEEVQSAPDPQKWGELAQSSLPFAPVIDGTIVPRHPLDAIRDGHGDEVELLIGTNREEARLMLVVPGVIDHIDDAAARAFVEAYGLSPEEALRTYRTSRPGASPGDLVAAVVTDWFFRIPAIRVVEARLGRARSWMYRFDWQAPTFDGRLGAAHVTEFPFVFDTAQHPSLSRLLGPSPPREVAHVTHGAWVRFVVEGNPGWAEYEADRRTTGLLHETLSVANDPDREERLLWEGRR